MGQVECLKINNEIDNSAIREGIKKRSIFLGKSPKLWVGGVQES